MAVRIVDVELEERKRALRARIAVSRRRIDGCAASLAAEKRRLTSWRTYVVQFPAAAAGFAFGAGVLLAGGLSPRRSASWIGRTAVTLAMTGVRSGLTAEYSDFVRRALHGAEDR